jgi:hypothetical protein
VWTPRPPVIVTVVGWCAILGGVSRLLFPEVMAARVAGLASAPWALMIVGAAAIVLWVYLTVLSFAKSNDASSIQGQEQ